MAELTVRIVATDRMVFQGSASLVVFDTLDGQIGVMAKHSPLMAVLRDAPVLIRTADQGDVFAAVHGGFVEVSDDHVKILSDLAELASQIDADRARRAKERAEAAIRTGDDVHALGDLARATSRLVAVEQFH